VWQYATDVSLALHYKEARPVIALAGEVLVRVRAAGVTPRNGPKGGFIRGAKQLDTPSAH